MVPSGPAHPASLLSFDASMQADDKKLLSIEHSRQQRHWLEADRVFQPGRLKHFGDRRRHPSLMAHVHLLEKVEYFIELTQLV
jgi:hypothetical protein